MTRAAGGGSDRARSATRRRVGACLGVLVAVATGLVVHLALPDGPATDIAGDALYAAAVFLGFVLVAPTRHPAVLAALAAAWCIAVELFQLTGLPERWGAAFAPATLVLGTVFDARDLVVYVVAIAAAATLDLMWRRRDSCDAR